MESCAQIGDKWRDKGENSGVWAIALPPNRKTAANGNGGGAVELWDVETGNVIARDTVIVCIQCTGIPAVSEC